MTALRQKWLSLPPSLRWSLIILFYLSLIGGYLLWQYQRPSGAALYSHNHTDRPIFSYWVNDRWGGNASAHGGGGAVCCSRIQGDTLKVVWIVSRTREQADRGLQEERHELDIPNPPRQREDQYLHVHFLPGNQVRLAWNYTVASPLAQELAERYPRKRHDDL
tara:strand:+ start:1775 stop:2263 length:489 start_codon:yes stop_codon:yes gene_type:complete